MVTISNRAWDRLSKDGCFSVKFSLSVLFAKGQKLYMKDAVSEIFGENSSDPKFFEEKSEFLADYHKDYLSDLFFFNGEYFEPKDRRFFEMDAAKSDFPHEKIIAVFNSVKPKTVAAVNVNVWDITGMRHKHLKQRWEYFKKTCKPANEMECVMLFARYFNYIFASDFLSNKTDGEFRTDFDWFMCKSNFEKITSGKYHKDGKAFNFGEEK